MRVLKEGAAYFGVVFLAGFLLGTIRILWVVPKLGTAAAELIETPIMLAVTFWAARWTIRRFAIPPGMGRRLRVGLVGAALLIAAEFFFVLRLRGLTIGEYAASRNPVATAVYVLSLCAFAVMPAIAARR
jgi:hypothetical membrane protein